MASSALLPNFYGFCRIGYLDVKSLLALSFLIHMFLKKHEAVFQENVSRLSLTTIRGFFL